MVLFVVEERLVRHTWADDMEPYWFFHDHVFSAPRGQQNLQAWTWDSYWSGDVESDPAICFSPVPISATKSESIVSMGISVNRNWMAFEYDLGNYKTLCVAPFGRDVVFSTKAASSWCCYCWGLYQDNYLWIAREVGLTVTLELWEAASPWPSRPKCVITDFESLTSRWYLSYLQPARLENRVFAVFQPHNGMDDAVVVVIDAANKSSVSAIGCHRLVMPAFGDLVLRLSFDDRRIIGEMQGGLGGVSVWPVETWERKTLVDDPSQPEALQVGRSSNYIYMFQKVLTNPWCIVIFDIEDKFSIVASIALTVAPLEQPRDLTLSADDCTLVVTTSMNRFAKITLNHEAELLAPPRSSPIVRDSHVSNTTDKI